MNDKLALGLINDATDWEPRLPEYLYQVLASSVLRRRGSGPARNTGLAKRIHS